MLRGIRTIVLAALLVALALPVTASALVRSGGVHKAAKARAWVVNGAGFGHGVGLSQYGAYGYAKHGFKYDQILTHYYTGTTIGSTTERSVRVLLRDGARSVAFRGAGSACGAGLSPGKGYVAKRKGSGVVVRNKKGRRIARCGVAMTAAGSPTVTVSGKGTYRGSLEVRASGSGLGGDQRRRARGLCERSGLEGVAGLLAARGAQGAGRRGQLLRALYWDSRRHLRCLRRHPQPGLRRRCGGDSQDRQAVNATHLQVVMYGTKIAQTFFSTSGGHTENNEFSSLGFGQPAIPYLRASTIPTRPTRARHTSTGSGSSRSAG